MSIEELDAGVSRLRERIAALEDALRPFASMADFFGPCDGPKKLILVGIFRYQADQARAALEEAPTEEL